MKEVYEAELSVELSVETQEKWSLDEIDEIIIDAFGSLQKEYGINFNWASSKIVYLNVDDNRGIN